MRGGEATVRNENSIGGHDIIELMHQPRHGNRRFIGLEALTNALAPRLHPPRDVTGVLGLPVTDGCSIVRESGDQIPDTFPCVTPKRHLRLARAAEFLGEDIEVDNPLADGRNRVAFRGDLAKLAADDEDQIGLFMSLFARRSYRPKAQH